MIRKILPAWKSDSSWDRRYRVNHVPVKKNEAKKEEAQPQNKRGRLNEPHMIGEVLRIKNNWRQRTQKAGEKNGYVFLPGILFAPYKSRDHIYSNG